MFCYYLPFADPNIMKKLQVDRGAIKFVLAGANIMCPGLTSPGGALDDEVGEETPVVPFARFFALYLCFFSSIIWAISRVGFLSTVTSIEFK